MTDLVNVPDGNRSPITTEKGTTPTVPTTYADSVRRVTDATTDNSVEDSLAAIETNEHTTSSRIDHLQEVVDAIKTGSHVWEPPTDLDFAGNFRIGTTVGTSATNFVDPRHPIVAAAAGSTHVDFQVPRGFDPELMRLAVTSGSTTTYYPGAGQEWNIIQRPGATIVDTYQLQTDPGRAVVNIAYASGDSFQMQLSSHEVAIPLEALEDGGAVEGSLMLYDDDWTAGPSIIHYLLLGLRQNRWRGEWDAGTYLDGDLCEYESKFYLRNGAGSDSGAQNPTANSSWQEVTISNEPLEYWTAQRMKAIASIHDSGQVDEDLHDAPGPEHLARRVGPGRLCRAGARQIRADARGVLRAQDAGQGFRRAKPCRQRQRMESL